MKAGESKIPVAAFALPPHQPLPVAEARVRFDRLGDEWAAAKGELRDANEAVSVARAADVRAIADAAAAGRKVVDQTKHEREARAKIEQLERRIEGLAVAVGEAGNELARVIGRNKAPWLELLAAAERDAASRYAAAVREALKALVDLAPARGAVEWIEQFDVSEAIVGRAWEFSGGRVRVEGESFGTFRGELDPAVLLKLAAKAEKPIEPPKSRRHKVAAR